MTHTKALTAAVGAAVLLGCTLRGPRAEISANEADLTPLVGKWIGEYSNEETDRTGSIWFTLRAEENCAMGSLEMVAPRLASASAVIAAPDRPIVTGPGNFQAKEMLTIHFVRKESNRVLGLLDPYTDPECACTVITSFQGVMSEDRIEGTYSTRSTELAHSPTVGHWKVLRVKL